MSVSLELGLDTFGDVTTGHDGHPLPHAEVIRHVIDEAVLADDLGIDFFGVGEHHRADFASLFTRGPAGRDRGAHQTNSAGLGSDGA